jgi:signal transduction histidine kinase/Flp pilus assembly protein TadD
LFLLSSHVIQLYAQNTDSLKTVLESADDQAKVSVLHELLLSVWLNYPDQAMAYGQQALEISQRLNDSTNISKSLRFIAGVYYYKGDFDTSLYYNTRALAIAMSIQDSSLINNGYNNIGLLYYNLGSYQTALEYLLRSLEIKKLMGEVYGYASTLNNIGLVFDKVSEFEMARENFFEALAMAHQTGNIDQEIYSQNNIATTYIRERKIEEASGYFLNALKLAKKVDNINWGAVSQRGIGQIFQIRLAYDSAEYYYLQALAASSSIDDKIGIVEVYHQMSKLYTDKGQYTTALEYLDKSQESSTKLKLKSQLLDNLRQYIVIFTKMEDDDNLITHQAKYIHFRDSLFNEVMLRNLAFVPIKIKEEADRLRFSQQQAEIQSKDLTNKIIIFLLIISVPFIFVLIFLLRKNMLTNKELVKNNEELKRTQNLLIKSEKMASLGVLSAGIGHEINNPLNFIQNGLLGLENEIKQQYNEVNQELQQYFDIINEGVVRVSNIVKSLGHFSRVGVNMDETCNMHDIIENCLVILNNKLKFKVELVKHYNAVPPTVQGNGGKLHQVFVNIISNAEQSIEKKGTITITTKVESGQMLISIEDTGTGIPQEYIQKISDPFFTTKEPGKGTGLGLFISYSIVNEHNGEINVTSGPEGGTRFNIVLPLKK